MSCRQLVFVFLPTVLLPTFLTAPLPCARFVLVARMRWATQGEWEDGEASVGDPLISAREHVCLSSSSSSPVVLGCFPLSCARHACVLHEHSDALQRKTRVGSLFGMTPPLCTPSCSVHSFSLFWALFLFFLAHQPVPWAFLVCPQATPARSRSCCGRIALLPCASPPCAGCCLLAIVAVLHPPTTGDASVSPCLPVPQKRRACTHGRVLHTRVCPAATHARLCNSCTPSVCPSVAATGVRTGALVPDMLTGHRTTSVDPR